MALVGVVDLVPLTTAREDGLWRWGLALVLRCLLCGSGRTPVCSHVGSGAGSVDAAITALRDEADVELPLYERRFREKTKVACGSDAEERLVLQEELEGGDVCA